MSITVAAAPAHQAEETDEKMRKARTLYETKLKAQLEPEFNNKFIAIEVLVIETNPLIGVLRRRRH